MADTKAQYITAFTNAINGSSGAGSTEELTDEQKAALLNACFDVIDTECVSNPNLKPMPTIKIRT